MKIRSGFISNSSSSSFVLIKSDLFNFPFCSYGEIKPEDKKLFEKIIEDWRKNNSIKENYLPIYTKEDTTKLIQTILDANENSEDPWRIEEYRDFLLFSTTLDNFDLKEYIENLIGREIHPIIDFPSYCGFDHWHDPIKTMKTMIDIGFSKEEQNEN